MNAATIVAGLVVTIVLLAAAYFSIRCLRSGKCDGCKECDKGRGR